MPRGRRIVFQQARIFLGCNTDRKCFQTHWTASERYLGDLAFHTEHAKQRRTELLQVRVGLKGKQIGSKEPFQQFLAPGEDGEDLRGWERYVQKEPHRSIRQPFAEHPWQEHQVVVVNPDQIIRPVVLDHRLAEAPVRFDIGFPVPRVEFQLRRKIVKHRPERLVGVAFVESSRHILRKLDREVVVRSGPLGENLLALLAVLPAVISGPANPLPTRPGDQWVHSAGQAPGTSRRVPALLGFL